MRNPEQRLWDRMRRALVGRVLLERIENVVAVGTPDVLALAAGHVTLIELKAVAENPVRAATRVLGSRGLSREQRNWHKRWTTSGGRSLIVVGVGSKTLHVLCGTTADAVNDMAAQDMADQSLAANWNELVAVLRREK